MFDDPQLVFLFMNEIWKSKLETPCMSVCVSCWAFPGDYVDI